MGRNFLRIISSFSGSRDGFGPRLSRWPVGVSPHVRGLVISRREGEEGETWVPDLETLPLSY